MTNNTKINAPCYKCPDRYPGCSDHCQKPEFLKDKARRFLIREGKKRERLSSAGILRDSKKYNSKDIDPE